MSVPVPCMVEGCQSSTLDRVCGGCATRYATALAAVPIDLARRGRDGDPLPGLAAELETTRLRQDQTRAEGPVVSGSLSRPLPWSDRAEEAAAALWAALAAGYQTLAPALPDPVCDCPDAPLGPLCWDAETWRWEVEAVLADRVPEPATLDGLATWLRRHRDDALSHPQAAMLVSDVLAAVAAAERAVDAPPALVCAGACDHCGRALYGRIGRGIVTCLGRRDDPGCGQSFSAGAKRRELLESLREHTATAAEIAHGLADLAGVKIDRGKLTVWATRVIDQTTDPRPKLPDRRTPEQFRAGAGRVYRIGDVLDLIVESATTTQVAADRRRAARPIQDPVAGRSRADIAEDLLHATG